MSERHTKHVERLEADLATALTANGEFEAVLEKMDATITQQRETLDKLPKWQPFDTAPADHTAIIAWREDAGVMAIIFGPPDHAYRDFSELDDDDNDWCWFTLGGEDLTGDLPTLWMHFPNEPEAAAALAKRSNDDSLR